MGPRYWGWRFQVDPLNPPPRRDIRWILIVLGVSFIIVSVLLLAVAAIVSAAVSAGCGTTPCPGPNPGPWFDWIGVPFLALGIALLLAGFWWALR